MIISASKRTDIPAFYTPGCSGVCGRDTSWSPPPL